MLRWGAAMMALAVAVAAHADYYSRAYGPRGNIVIRRPILTWQLRAVNGATVRSVTASLNGAPIACSYSASDGAASADPGRTLPAGNYKVDMIAETGTGGEIKKSWNFEVDARAIVNLPDVSFEQDLLFAAVNRFRRSIGLPETTEQVRLMSAANGHANYLAVNNLSGHYQKAERPLFFGETPMDRTQAYGYVDGIWEVVHSGKGNPDDVVANLVSAPYHRLPFLQPGPVPVGTGVRGDRSVILFGMLELDQWVAVHPIPNQRNVPCQWTLMERPDPLRIHPGAQRPTGYPIVLSVYNKNEVRLKVQRADLRNVASGQAIPVYVNTPANDSQLKDAAVIIPKKPLEPGKTYQATIQGTLSNGSWVKKTWQFSTAPQESNRF